MPAGFSISVDESKDMLASRHCVLKTLHFVNADAGVRYLQCFASNNAAGITLGTTPPDMVIPMASSQTFTVQFGDGLAWSNGFIVCATTTATGSTPVTADAFVSITYD